jgi:rifampicin phosphotransferase
MDRFSARASPVRFVVFPEEITGTTPAGGKARALAEMTAAALPIPAWFVVLPAAFDAGATATWRAGATTATTDAASIRRVPLGDAVRLEVEEALGAVGTATDLYAVRSSARDEDSASLSFAGQLESYLCVAAKDVPERIAAVWASGFGERLLGYRRELGLDPFGGVPAVIVQRLIDGAASGVAFSADPVSGRRGIAVLAAAPGLGSAVVSGEAEADTWKVDRKENILERRIARKRVTHRRDPASPDGVCTVFLDDFAALQPTLTDTQILQVAALARRTEALFGRPQDIEWTISGDRTYLLQSRPITTLADKPDPDAPHLLWDNANIVESYSGITTPLTFSFAQRAYEHVYREFCRLAGVPEGVIEEHDHIFPSMLGLVRGRVYYNLHNWYRLVALLPGYRFNRRFLEQMLGVGERGPDEPHGRGRDDSSGYERALDTLLLARTLTTLVVRLVTLPRRIRAFQRRLAEALGTHRPDVSGLRPDELVASYRALERRLLRHWDAPVLNDFATMVFHGLLRELATRWVDDSAAGLHNDLLCAARGMISEEPARRIAQMAQQASTDEAMIDVLCNAPAPKAWRALAGRPTLMAEVQEYLARFGDRCAEELKLESRTLHDDPTPLFRAVGEAARREVACDAVPSRADEKVREAAEARARQRLQGDPLRRLAFGWVLRLARDRVRDRENLRFERTRVFGRARLLLSEIGRRYAAVGCLAAPEDVFYLELDEVLGFPEGRVTAADLEALVASRKAEYQRYRELPPPADRFETVGLVHRGNDFQPAVAPGAPAGIRLTGLGCCPGIVRGPVRVVRDPRTATLHRGEILVAQRTDPGWVMIFPAAAGLLVEHGSLLSHSAIVARELGLPAIVSLAGLTGWLADGDWVEMDGSIGTVVKVDTDGSPRH